jgi:hypothetical protein
MSSSLRTPQGGVEKKISYALIAKENTSDGFDIVPFQASGL